MKFEWKESELFDAVSLVIDYRGKTPKKLGGDWVSNGYRALSAKNIKTGQIVQPETIRYVSREMYKQWMKEEIRNGDIIITSEAPFGEVFYWNSDEKIVLSQRLFGVRIKDEFDSAFMYYYMTSDAFQGELRARATGTTVIGLRQPELLKCKIRYPHIDTQKKIASILMTIDEKINLNNAINNNLQQQAQALFKAWFVDFEPFGGEMPTEWRLGKLKDVLRLKRDGIKVGDEPSLPYLPIDIIPMKTFAVSEFKPNEDAQSSLITFDKDDIVIGAMRVYFHRVIFAPCRGITRTTCFTLKPYDADFLSFGLLCCDQDSSIDYAQTTSKGSTMPYAVWEGGLGDMEIAIPSKDVAKKFNDTVLPMLHHIQESYFENRNLVKLRDSLLPKLMNGEIDVSNIEI